jgi:hypothetical protein
MFWSVNSPVLEEVVVRPEGLRASEMPERGSLAWFRTLPLQLEVDWACKETNERKKMK